MVNLMPSLLASISTTTTQLKPGLPAWTISSRILGCDQQPSKQPAAAANTVGTTEAHNNMFEWVTVLVMICNGILHGTYAETAQIRSAAENPGV